MKRYCPSICKTVDAEMGTYTLSILDDVIATVINCRVASITHLPSFCSHTTHKYGRTEKKKKTWARQYWWHRSTIQMETQTENGHK